MLYVFLVDEGTMYKFDMNVALSSVSNLKETIERIHKIPAQNIVLLVSGGEMLTKSTQVSFYSAGTDTNPIYMFLVGDLSRPQPSLPSIDSDISMKESVEQCLAMAANYDTVVSRARLAQQMYELAREEEAICEQLVHEQHLQQQGWSAVVANMEDLTDEFRQRFKDFCLSFDQHLEIRSSLFDLLNSFSQDLSNLSRIPILPGLMQMAQEDFRGFDGLLDNDEVFSQSNQNVSVLMAPEAQCSTTQPESDLQDDDKRETTSPNKKAKMGSDDQKSDIDSAISTGSEKTRRTLTLLQWISAKENNNKLKEMADECIQSLNAFNEVNYAKLKEEVDTVIRSADQTEMKEVRGLSERLCKLEEMKYKIKHMVQDQKELSSAFQQNQNRAINLKDASILPDLCASHKSQLMVMLQNHQKIKDFHRCIAKAKNELGLNLHTRLKRIIVLENKMSELDNRQLFYHRCLRRAERHIRIIEQIHRAPSIYVAAVTEVVRRKIFSQEFRQWASKLAVDFDTIHSEEIDRRRNFNASFEGHFLNILFPGMNDMPPAFANENPLGFDTSLPNLTKSDIDILKASLPDLMEHIYLPDMKPVVNFFVSRSGNQQSSSKDSSTNKMITSGTNASSVNIQHQRISDLQTQMKDGCEESETDTEEFEKVIQSEMEVAIATTSESTSGNVVHAGTSTDPLETNTVETLTEENLGSTRLEVERLKSILKSMADVSTECLNLARVNCDEIKTEQELNQVEFRFQFENITEKWKLAQMQYMSCQNEMYEMATKYQTEIDNLKTVINSKDTQIQELKNEQLRKEIIENEKIALLISENDDLKDECDKLKKQIESLNICLENGNADKLRAIAEAREELIHEHKSEIESLRCRYKLMTSMEHSPSDTSLEKIDKFDVANTLHQDALIAQMRQQFHEEQEEAVKKAVEMERSKWEAKQNQNSTADDISNNPDMLKVILEEKEKHIDMLQEKTTILDQENLQLKTQLSTLTNDDGNSWLKEKIEILNKEKIRIEEQLNVEKSKRSEMEQSVAILKGSVMEASAVLPRSRSKSNRLFAVLESCRKGDIVFVVWNSRHKQYVIVQDSPRLCFAHSDSFNALNLKLPTSGETDIPPIIYTLARVVRKEFCQARKDKNRYKVSKGSMFYRVLLEPLSCSESKFLKSERLESSSSSASINRPLCPTDSNEPTTSRLTSPNEQSSIPLIDPKELTESVPPSCEATESIEETPMQTLNAMSPIPSTCSAVDSNINDKSVIKERTISITSVTEDDDEPISLISDRCCYISVSEEEEPNRSVITEQPTLSCFPPMDTASTSSPTTNAATTTSQCALTTNRNAKPMQILANIGNCSLEKDTDDSDEYRSLEAKDENDFPSTSQN